MHAKGERAPGETGRPKASGYLIFDGEVYTKDGVNGESLVEADQLTVHGIQLLRGVDPEACTRHETRETKRK